MRGLSIDTAVSGREKLRDNGIGAMLAKGASGRFLVTVIGTGINFGIQVLLARVLGVTQFGIFVYVLSWLNFLVVFSKLGFDMALLRYVAAYNAGEEWGKFRGILDRSNRTVLVLSIAISGAGALFVWLLRQRLEKELLYTFWIGFLALPVLSLSALRQAVLRSLKSVVLAQLPESIARPLLLALFTGIIFFGLSAPLSSSTAMGVNLAAVFLSFMLGTYWLTGRLPGQVKGSTPDYRSGEWLRAALPLLFISAANMAIHQVDTIMVGFFRGTIEAGIYNSASRVATLILFGLTAVNAIAAPMISEFYSQGRMKDLQRMVTLASRGIFVYSLPVFIVIAVFGRWILGLFGPAFTAGYAALVVLAAGQLVSALSGSVGSLMTMTGHQREASWIIGTGAAVNIVLNAVLIPEYGIEGAAAATSLTIAMWNIGMFAVVRKKLGINPSVF